MMASELQPKSTGPVPDSPYPGNSSAPTATPNSPYPGNQTTPSKTPGSLLPGNQGTTLPKSERTDPSSASNSSLVWPANQEWFGPFLLPWTSRTLHDWMVFGIGVLLTIVAVIFLLSHEARDIVPVATKLAAS